MVIGKMGFFIRKYSNGGWRACKNGKGKRMFTSFWQKSVLLLGAEVCISLYPEKSLLKRNIMAALVPYVELGGTGDAAHEKMQR
jgi:hypothetical protein